MNIIYTLAIFFLLLPHHHYLLPQQCPGGCQMDCVNAVAQILSVDVVVFLLESSVISCKFRAENLNSLNIKNYKTETALFLRADADLQLSIRWIRGDRHTSWGELLYPTN